MPVNKVYYLALVGSKEEGKHRPDIMAHCSNQYCILQSRNFLCMFILPATRTSFNDVSPNTAYIYPIQNWNISFKVTYPTLWNHATSKLEEVPERCCVSQWGIACSRAEAEKAHCCLYDFPPSSETNLHTALVGRAGQVCQIASGTGGCEGPSNGAGQGEPSKSAAEDLLGWEWHEVVVTSQMFCDPSETGLRSLPYLQPPLQITLILVIQIKIQMVKKAKLPV